MIAARVDNFFSMTNKDLREIDGRTSLSEMTYIDHLRQEVIFFAFIEKSSPSKKFKISGN
jgi:hypothetical protein